MTIRYRACLPPGVNALPARKYPRAGARRKAPPKGSLDEFRGRAAAHIARHDVVVIWNSALNVALDRLASEPNITRERAIELVTSARADA